MNIEVLLILISKHFKEIVSLTNKLFLVWLEFY